MLVIPDQFLLNCMHWPVVPQIEHFDILHARFEVIDSILWTVNVIERLKIVVCWSRGVMEHMILTIMVSYVILLD